MPRPIKEACFCSGVFREKTPITASRLSAYGSRNLFHPPRTWKPRENGPEPLASSEEDVSRQCHRGSLGAGHSLLHEVLQSLLDDVVPIGEFLILRTHRNHG